MGTSSLHKYNKDEVAVLIPAYNEEKYIEKTIRTLQNGEVGKIYVADDASTDSTREIAERLGVNLIKATKNLGKGGVLNFALPQTKEEIVLLLDADLGESSTEGIKLINAIFDGADLAVGLFRSRSGFGFVRRLSSLLLYLHTGRYFYAPLSGQRAAKREVWQRLLPFAPGFSLEVNMLKKACKEGIKVVEVEVSMKDRSYGKGFKGFKHRFQQLIAVLKGLRL